MEVLRCPPTTGLRPTRVMFIYLGRRGLSRFALNLARAAQNDESLTMTFVVSRQNELYDSFAELNERHVAVDTFSTDAGAVSCAWKIPFIRKDLKRAISRERPEFVIELMPHAWSSFLIPVVKSMGVCYVPIIHDALPHVGDYRSASIKTLLRRSARQCDYLITLSGAVAGQLAASGTLAHQTIIPMFHPDLDLGVRHSIEAPRPDGALRLMFVGRIMAYKALPLFLDMIDELRRRGVSVDAGVFGEGNIGPNAKRLAAMRVEVINRWLTEAEIGDAFSQYHAVVVSHIMASQSGIVALAHGAGVPVIATPVGGVVEQIQDGVTGLLAQRADAWALADAAQFLMSNPRMYEFIRASIMSQKDNRSMARFVRECVGLLNCHVGSVDNVAKPSS